MEWQRLWELFLIFLKVNLLSPSGPASLGIVYQQTVPKLITEEQFVEVASFSRILPGSDALQLAVFVGHNAAGWKGAVVATTAAILPPHGDHVHRRHDHDSGAGRAMGERLCPRGHPGPGRHDGCDRLRPDEG